MNEKFLLKINNCNIAMHIWGSKKENPVLLFVHGGPGNPIRHKIKKHLLPLADSFTIASYDQRGCGDSRATKISPFLQTQLEDLYQISLYLKKRFSKAPLILIGESWGSFLGSLEVESHPELYAAYIGYGQITDDHEMYKEQFRLLLNRLKKEKNRKEYAYFAEKMDDFLANPDSEEYGNQFNSIYYKTLEPKGFPSYAVREIKPFKLSSEYGKIAKKNVEKDSQRAGKQFFSQGVPLTLKGHSTFKIPYYVFVGEHDIVTPAKTSAEYLLNDVQAPAKEVFYFPNAGHTLPFDCPKEFMAKIRELFSKKK